MAFVNFAALAGASAANAAVPVPAGGANLHIAIVGLYLESTATITTVPAGFTNKVNLATSAGSRGRLAVYWKRLTGADSGTYTFAWTGSTFRSGISGLWSGRVTSGDPFDGTVGTAESVAAVTTLNVSTSPALAGGDAVGFWSDFSTAGGFTQPTGYTERGDTAAMTMDTRDNIAAGSTGNVTATQTTSDFMKAFLGVLAPAGASIKVPSTRSQYAGFY